MVRSEKEDKSVRSSETLALLVSMVVLVLIGVAMFNPCSLIGHHDLMVPAEYRCQDPLSGVAIRMCAFEVRVCRRCKLLYLDRAEAEAGKKP